MEGARLVPAPLDKRLKFSPFKYGRTAREQVPISSVQIIGGTIAIPDMELFDPMSKKWITLGSEPAKEALAMKQKNWQKNGLITHADSHYIAAALLMDPTHRALFAATIAKRFPIILVDEFQDTMWFLSRALLALLECDLISAIVVGDPDQSIYEFGGASSNLFDEVAALSGAKRYPITISQRFGKNICKVVSALSHSGTVVSCPKDSSPGRTILLTHELKDDQLNPTIASQLFEKLGLRGDVVLLARNKRICRRLSILTDVDSFAGTSSIGKHLDTALLFLRLGENTKAANIVARELWNLLSEEEGLPTARELNARGIDRPEWRRYLYSILTESQKCIEGEKWNDWLVRVKVIFEETLSKLGETKKLGTLFRTDKTGDLVRTVRNLVSEDALQWQRILTIHQAKGAQFDNVLILFGKPHKGYSPCISSQWWGGASIEEKRIGFVALSRPKETLALCVHKETLISLKKQQGNFVQLFSETATL
jgi:DNA helicase-2/ATP-dependent DNA helicase PcrA